MASTLWKTRISSLCCTAAILLAAPSQEARGQVTSVHNLADLPGFVAMAELKSTKKGATDMFEFSGLAVAGSRVIVVDNESDKLGENSAGITDDTKQAFFEVLPAEAGSITVRRAFAAAYGEVGKDVNDLEALAMLDGRLYAMASHSLKNDGRYNADRYVMLQVSRPDGAGGGEDIRRTNALAEALLELAVSNPDLGFNIIQAPDKGGLSHPVIENLNIEGLAAVPDHDGLLVGLRGPLCHGEAIVLQLHNPADLFDGSGKKPKLTVFKKLKLGGRGISALEFDSVAKSVLIGASGAEESGQASDTQLWQWPHPVAESTPQLVWSFIGHKLEGVCRLPVGSPHEGRLLLAFDEEIPGPQTVQFGRLVSVNWLP